MTRALLALLLVLAVLGVTYTLVLDSVEEQHVGIAPEAEVPEPEEPAARPAPSATPDRVSEGVVEATPEPVIVIGEEPEADAFSVVGTVRNDEGLLLSGVRLSLSIGYGKVHSRRYGGFYAWSAQEMASTTSNKLGEYEFDLRPLQEDYFFRRRRTEKVFHLRGQMPGYIDYHEDFPIPADRHGVTQHDVVFVPGEMKSGLVRCNDLAVPDAEVLILDHETREVLGRTETNRQGEYRIAVREAGTYDFLARRDGFGVGVHRGLTVPLGQKAKLPVLHLEGVGLLAGRVRFPGGKAVGGLRMVAVPEEFAFGERPHLPEERRIEVELEGEGLYGSESLTVPAGEHMGRFEFRGLKPGRYRLTFPSHPQPDLQAVELHDTGNESIDITYTNPRLRVVAIAHDYGGEAKALEKWFDPRSGKELSQPSRVRVELEVARIVVSEEGVLVEDHVPGPPSVPSSGPAFFEVDPSTEYIVRARGVGLEETFVTLKTPARITETTATLFLYPFGYDGPRDATAPHDERVTPRLCFELVDEEGEPVEGVPLRVTLRTAEGDALGSLTDVDVSNFSGGCVPVPPGVFTYEVEIGDADSLVFAPEGGTVEAALGKNRRIPVVRKLGGRLLVKAHWPQDPFGATSRQRFAMELVPRAGGAPVPVEFRHDGRSTEIFPLQESEAPTTVIAPGRYELRTRPRVPSGVELPESIDFLDPEERERFLTDPARVAAEPQEVEVVAGEETTVELELSLVE